MANCAFYLAQGMVVAQRFAQAMGVNFNKCLKVKYPFTNGDNAFCWNKFAGIGKPYFDDFDTETDGCVTVRDRDTMEQIRIKIEEVSEYIKNKMKF